MERDALEKARRLLKPGEDDLPPGVKVTVAFFARNDLWFTLSRNDVVRSCRDAATRRYRLGRRGIPLADELRSYVVEAESEGEERTYVLAHCRADNQVNVTALANLSVLNGFTVKRASLEELSGESIGYGLINPFSAPTILGPKGRVLQVFDPGVLNRSGETLTMMTNAGDLTWAIEFDPAEILSKQSLVSVSLAPIALSDGLRGENEIRSIGILTGNAPESGALLWSKINQGFKRRRGDTFRGDVSFPKVVIHSLPAMGWSMELEARHNLLRPLIMQEVHQMVASGVEVIAFACNTTQFFGPEVQTQLAETKARFVALPDAISGWIEASKEKSVYVMGIGYVTGVAEWSAFPFLKNRINVRVPTPTESSSIDRLAFEVKQSGVTSRTYQKFRSLARHVKDQRILLLLTELSLIFEKYPRQNFGVEIVDGLDIYAETILDVAMEK